jgi:hypothetical protein
MKKAAAEEEARKKKAEEEAKKAAEEEAKRKAAEDKTLKKATKEKAKKKTEEKTLAVKEKPIPNSSPPNMIKGVSQFSIEKKGKVSNPITAPQNMFNGISLEKKGKETIPQSIPNVLHETPLEKKTEESIPKSCPLPNKNSTVADVINWLVYKGFGEFQKGFKDNQIEGEAWLDLTDSDLKELGVTKMGARKIILSAIREAKNRLSIGKTPTFYSLLKILSSLFSHFNNNWIYCWKTFDIF